MRSLAAALALLLLVALAGCDRRLAEAQSNRSSKPLAASTQSPSPVKVMEEPTVAAGDEGHSCGGKEMEGGECAGGCDQWDEAAAEVAKRTVPTDARWSTIAVGGMTCGGCERRIIANLGKLEGVLAVEADAELGQVRVATSKDADLRTTAIERIRSLGYTAQ